MEDLNNNNVNNMGDDNKMSNKWSWIIAVVAIIALLIGVYMWPGTREYIDEVYEFSGPDAATESLNTVNSSDEISALEEDIAVTDLENLDAELANIEAELNQAK